MKRNVPFQFNLRLKNLSDICCQLVFFNKNELHCEQRTLEMKFSAIIIMCALKTNCGFVPVV